MSLSQPASRQVRLGALIIRINWVILACVLFTIFGFLRLGLWQWSRAGEKLEAQAAFEVEQTRNPTALEDLPAESLANPGPDLANLHVVLQGEYWNARTILVLAQFHDDQIGYEVITPLRLQDSGRLVLVSRGWTTGILPPGASPDLRPVAGPVQLTAQVHVPDPDARVIPSQLDASQWPLRVRGIELPILADVLGEDLFPYVVRLTAGQPGVLARHWPETNADVNTHLSYALQWFTFAVMVALSALVASSNVLALLRDPKPGK
ncbi:MAG: hypothetical protein RLZZ385_279 [Pseudomonadota bacterium]|jgi:surfeit locus 1 family protein